MNVLQLRDSVASLKWESYPPLGTALRAIFARAEPGFTHTGAFRTFVDCYEILLLPHRYGALETCIVCSRREGSLASIRCALLKFRRHQQVCRVSGSCAPKKAIQSGATTSLDPGHTGGLPAAPATWLCLASAGRRHAQLSNIRLWGVVAAFDLEKAMGINGMVTLGAKDSNISILQPMITITHSPERTRCLPQEQHLPTRLLDVSAARIPGLLKAVSGMRWRQVDAILHTLKGKIEAL